MRPPGTVRFQDASIPDTKPNNLEEERPFQVPPRETKARNRIFKKIPWVVRDLQKDGTCLPQQDTTDKGWRIRYTDDLIAKLPDCPLLGVKTFDESLTFNKTRHTNERLNADWKRAIVIALDFSRRYTPIALYQRSD